MEVRQNRAAKQWARGIKKAHIFMVAVERRGDSSCVFRICVITEAIITVAFELTLFLGGI
jgi:hypothetical protein